MKKIVIFAIVLCVMSFRLYAYTVGVKDSKLNPAQEKYYCEKTDEKITIDGKLDENAWKHATEIEFRGIVDGTKPHAITECKTIWDDKYLYVGFYFECSDIRCYWTLNDENIKEDARLAVLTHRKKNWAYTECDIMRVDSFAKIFLDPDGDGSNYIEFHINPANNVFDAWYKQGFSDDKWLNRDRIPDVAWSCPGLLTATHIYGSLNASHDVDKGWSVEVAIPWSSLKPFMQGACPPKNNDLWGAHFGKVERDRIGGKNQYWTWPCLEVVNCHLPDRYAKLIFKDNTAQFDRLFAFSARYNEDFIRQAADIGVTDLCGKPSEKIISLCNKYKINFYGLITLNPSEWNKAFTKEEPPLQEMSKEENRIKDLLTGKTVPVNEGEKGEKEPENWQISKQQLEMIKQMQKNNYKLKTSYQWGGEPLRKHDFGQAKAYNDDVLFSDLLCFHHPKVLEALKMKIKEYMSFDGIAGITFDGIGYQNYHDCKCPESMKQYKIYCRKNKLRASSEAQEKFSLKSLVDFNNKLVDYVHALNPNAKTFNHIWPVYMPEPLYGNRLKVDYCGQTAAWYFYWTQPRIENYSQIISRDQNKYWPNVKGVAFIGYYDRELFPYKSAEKVEHELRAILNGGSRMLMVCGLTDVLKNPDITSVFKKYVKK